MKTLACLLGCLALQGCGQYFCASQPSTCDTQEPYGVGCEAYPWYASHGFQLEAQAWVDKCDPPKE